MYDRRLIRLYMRRYHVTIAEIIQRYRHIDQGITEAYGIAVRDNLDVQHIYKIQFVVDTCRAEARRAGFAVGVRAWESGVTPVFGHGMEQAAQLYNYRRLADGERRSIFR